MNNQVDSAFPTETLMNEVVTVISGNPGIKMSDLERHINMKPVKIKAWFSKGSRNTHLRGSESCPFYISGFYMLNIFYGTVQNIQ